jgi:mannose-6-phosphate isomerase-like protein (cupin superfamily)
MQRRDLFALAVVPSMHCLAALSLNSAERELVPNGVVTKDAVRIDRIPGIGESRTYYGGRTDQLKDLSVGTWRVLPGKSPHGVHTHAEEELLVFAEGMGEVSINGERSKVSVGSVMHCASNLPHGVYNTGSDDMLFYFVKWIA